MNYVYKHFYEFLSFDDVTGHLLTADSYLALLLIIHCQSRIGFFLCRSVVCQFLYTRSNMAYTPAIATTGSILLSQGCIFWQLVVEWVYIAAQLRNLQLQHRETENLVFADHFPPVLTVGEPLPTLYRAPLYTASTYCTSRAQLPKRLTNFPGYSCSDTVLTWCVEPCMAGRPLLLPDS